MTTINEFYKEQTSESAETSVESEDVYKLGVNIGESNQLTINNSKNYNQASKLGQFYTSNYLENSPQGSIQADFNLINGVPLRWVFGKTTSVTTDQRRTITLPDLTSGQLPRLTLGQILGSDKSLIFGAVFNEITLQQNIVNGGEVRCTLNGMGLNRVTPAYTPNNSQYADSVHDLYNVPNYFKWNDESLNPVSVQFKSSHDLITHMGDDGYYDHLNENSPMVTIMSIQMLEYNANLKADYDAETLRQIKWKFSKAADNNNYIELDSGSANCYCILYNPIIDNVGAVIGYNASFILENFSWDVNDYLDDDFYTKPSV